MDIDIKDIITLSDDREYVVASKTSYQDNVYYYLIGGNSKKNIKFCIENSSNSSLIEIEDKELIQHLLPLFLKATSKSISKEELELLEQDIE